MKVTLTILLLIILVDVAQPQLGVDIPLVVIESNGGFPIPDEPKIKAHMKIIDHGPGNLNYASDSGNIYDGNVGKVTVHEVLLSNLKNAMFSEMLFSCQVLTPTPVSSMREALPSPIWGGGRFRSVVKV